MNPLIVRLLGQSPYMPIWLAMQEFTMERRLDTPDELWLVEHTPVYTRGRNAREAGPSGPIPVIDTDRGGDLTYHGPGQLVVYTLFDLSRMGIGVRQLVYGLEAIVLTTLNTFQITGERRVGAPGIYVKGQKIASLGLRIRNGRSYHGLALNVHMDLGPFNQIAPCGYHGLTATDMAAYMTQPPSLEMVRQTLLDTILTYFSFIPEDSPHGPRYGFTKDPIACPKRHRENQDNQSGHAS